jgi:hypothetical protein
MAEERNEEVLARVRELLDKYPELNARQLHDMAVRMDTSLAAMPLRSFHARYVLPIKRARAAAARPPAPRRKRAVKAAGGRRASRTRASSAHAHEADAQRTRVRGLLVTFARDIAAAESRADLVDVLGRIDTYVDDILGDGA